MSQLVYIEGRGDVWVLVPTMPQPEQATEPEPPAHVVRNHELDCNLIEKYMQSVTQDAPARGTSELARRRFRTPEARDAYFQEYGEALAGIEAMRPATPIRRWHRTTDDEAKRLARRGRSFTPNEGRSIVRPAEYGGSVYAENP